MDKWVIKKGMSGKLEVWKYIDDISEARRYWYVSKDVPATVVWYFVEMASQINADTFVLENGSLSPEGRNFYTQLSQDMTLLCAPLVGADELNFNQNLSMAEFKEIFLDFYCQYEAKQSESAD